jgi:hypothetical protein
MSTGQFAEHELSQLLAARAQLPKRVALGCAALIAVMLVLMIWVVSRPDAYQEHVAQPVTASAAWPDGSPRTANDWWASPQVAAPGAPQASAHG